MKISCTLAECPIGLFLCGDELCLKTEYGKNDGSVDAYIVSSGESFWGDLNTGGRQQDTLVIPIEVTGFKSIDPPQENG